MPRTPLMWIVDPIDGTRAYHFRPGRLVDLGGAGRRWPSHRRRLYAPVSEEIFLVSRDAGATLNGTPIKVSDGDGLSGAKIAGPKRYLDRLSRSGDGTLAAAESPLARSSARARGAGGTRCRFRLRR